MVANVCAALHNICIEEGAGADIFEYQNHEDPEINDNEPNQNAQNGAVLIRNAIRDALPLPNNDD